MRSDLKAMMDTDLVTAFDDQGDTATILTQSNVPVVCSSTNNGQEIDDIGQMAIADLSLVVRTASLTVTPILNATVVFNTVTYRIGGIETHPDGNAITLLLQRVHE